MSVLNLSPRSWGAMILIPSLPARTLSLTLFTSSLFLSLPPSVSLHPLFPLSFLPCPLSPSHLGLFSLCALLQGLLTPQRNSPGMFKTLTCDKEVSQDSEEMHETTGSHWLGTSQVGFHLTIVCQSKSQMDQEFYTVAGGSSVLENLPSML